MKLTCPSNRWPRRATLLTHLAALCLLSGSVLAEEQPIFRDARAPVEDRVEDLLKRLTLEEKILLCHSESNAGRAENFQSGGVPRLNIEPLHVTDGPVGIRTFDQTPATALPCTLSLSCTWDAGAAKAYGQLIAEEALALGKNVVFGPGINLMRSPLCGRNFEYLGEDPFLCGSLAASYIHGVQDQGVAACAKHLVANDCEFRRHFTSANMDERTLREMSLMPFEMAVHDAHVWSIMSANSLLDGVHVAENHRLLQDILKDELGFDGVMVTDWRAAYSAVPSALAGMDCTMGFCGYVFGDGKLLDAVKSGAVPASLIDDKARRLLRLYIRTGVLDPAARDKGEVDSTAHRAIARQLAAEGMVLLKNTGGLLPLDATKVHRLMITGPGAESVPAGRGSSAVLSSLQVNPLQGLTAALGERVKITSVPWRDGGADSKRGKNSAIKPVKPELETLLNAARDADLVLFFVTDAGHGEGNDLTNFDLPNGQGEAIAALAAVNPRIAVVLLTGEPVSLEPWADQVPAIVAAWYAGEYTGDAVADVLTGKVTPGGKLSCTFGKRLEDYSCHSLNLWPARLVADQDPGEASFSPVGRKAAYAFASDYKEGVFMGYRWFDDKKIEPRFPFGHGLSYTTFAVSDLKVDSGRPAIQVECTVKNTGDRSGAEVVQIYIASPKSSVPRPPRELKGFARIDLKPGESRQVDITLPANALAFYDVIGKDWKAEAGDYEIQVGTSSRDIRLRSIVKLEADKSSSTLLGKR